MIRISLIFYNIKVYCVFSLESPHWGDSNEYTQYTVFNMKKENHTKLSQIWVKGFFLCLPSRKIIVLQDRSKFTSRKSCKWWLWPWKHYNPHQKKADVVMLFLSLCVNNRCQTENNKISRHLWVKDEYRQLEINVSQKILTKIHCIISV